jgi:hypothetical protein
MRYVHQTTPVVDQFAALPLAGDIIDHGWLQHLQLGGTAYWLAASILADIVYHYRPREVEVDEDTVLIRNRFTGQTGPDGTPWLHRTRKQWARLKASTPRQVGLAIHYLAEQGYVKLAPASGALQGFLVQPVFERVYAITLRAQLWGTPLEAGEDEGGAEPDAGEEDEARAEDEAGAADAPGAPPGEGLPPRNTPPAPAPSREARAPASEPASRSEPGVLPPGKGVLPRGQGVLRGGNTCTRAVQQRVSERVRKRVLPPGLEGLRALDGPLKKIPPPKTPLTPGGSSPALAGGTPSSPGRSTDPRLPATRALMEYWQHLYTTRRIERNLTYGPGGDPEYEARWGRWKWAFYFLLTQGHTPDEVRFALSRALGTLAYPEWPAPFLAKFLHLLDPKKRLIVFGLWEQQKAEVRAREERAEADAARELALFAALEAEQGAGESLASVLGW